MKANGLPLVKVVLRVVSEGEEEVETPWAKQLGPSEFQLDNIPSHAYGISTDDVFEALPTADDPRPHFVRVLHKSGNRTVRVVLRPPSNESEASMAVLRRLKELGCTYEGMNHSYFAVNIPPEAEFHAVTAFLTDAGLTWEHADPTYEALHGTVRDDN